MPRRLGQHFLIDQGVLAEIVKALDLTEHDRVIEIGAGQGVLTRVLAKQAGAVVGIELDGGLIDRLRHLFATEPNVTILHENALDLDPCRLSESRAYKLAGNIPYYITGSLLRRYIGSKCRPQLAVLMVQSEVAQRMLAKPGDMNLLALSTQLYTQPSMVMKVSPKSFRPPPKVDSAVIKLLALDDPLIPVCDEENLFRVARAGFSGKRKQIINSLAHGLSITKEQTAAILERSGVQPTSRAEDLSLEQWALLSGELDADLATGPS